MKLVALLGLALLQLGNRQARIPEPGPQYFAYQRSVVPSAKGTNCAVVDAPVFAHAAASLRDLRLYPRTANARDLPYAITLSEPVQPDTEPASVLNLGTSGDKFVFDLAMPRRAYTSVALDLGARDFIATATVTGVDSPGDVNGTRLGDYTLFDLSSQHLSRSTVIALEESNFPYLHIALSVAAAPGSSHVRFTPQIVLGATVPPSREAQSIYTLAAESTDISEGKRATIVRFRLPERVPVERVSFVLAPEFQSNFSRDITIASHPAGTTSTAGELIDGNIFHVQMMSAGREIRQQRLSVAATLGSNLQSAADVEVTIHNGDDRPLPLKAVRLEMRQRKLCFDAASDAPLTLFYGDDSLVAPQYDFGRTFLPGEKIREARMGPEQKNPAFIPRPDTRAATERHPELVWIVFLAVICVLAVIALRAMRRLPR